MKPLPSEFKGKRRDTGEKRSLCRRTRESTEIGEAMAECLSMGILIDIVDEEWMKDTLPDDGIFVS